MTGKYRLNKLCFDRCSIYHLINETDAVTISYITGMSRIDITYNSDGSNEKEVEDAANKIKTNFNIVESDKSTLVDNFMVNRYTFSNEYSDDENVANLSRMFGASLSQQSSV